jgi:phosphotransferase system  glucose/maltose/N-acetylglucosamine-specific IIC component
MWIRKINVADVPLAILMLGGMALGIGGAFKHHSPPASAAAPTHEHGMGAWQRLWQ